MLLLLILFLIIFMIFYEIIEDERRTTNHKIEKINNNLVKIEKQIDNIFDEID